MVPPVPFFFEDRLQRTAEHDDAKRMPACKQVASPIVFKMLFFSKSWVNGVENCDIPCNLDAKTRGSASAEVSVYVSAYTYTNRCVGVDIYIYIHLCSEQTGPCTAAAVGG